MDDLEERNILDEIDNNIIGKLSSSELLEAVKYRGDIYE